MFHKEGISDDELYSIYAGDDAFAFWTISFMLYDAFLKIKKLYDTDVEYYLIYSIIKNK